MEEKFVSIPRILYLVLALAGVVTTWYYNLQYLQETGGSFSFAAFMAAAATNAASKSLSWDLTIACIAGLLWIFFESRRLGLRFFWVYILLAFGVAFAFAFPLFLFVRQGRLESMQNDKT
jgi:Terpene cyclase DEP1